MINYWGCNIKLVDFNFKYFPINHRYMIINFDQLTFKV